MKKNINYQDSFLNILCKNKSAVSIFTTNGLQLKGKIKCFDAYVIMLENDEKVQMIYKHAISTVLPHGVVKLDF